MSLPKKILTAIFAYLESGKSRKWLIAFAAIYLGIHLLTLPLFPLPWQDEAYNASITKSLITHGKFIPQAVFYATDLKEDIRYGPVFFLLAGALYQSFGLGILPLRLLSFFSGLCVLWIIFRFLRSASYRQGLALVVVILLATDPFFGRCLHEGRMDLTALCLILGALFLFAKSVRAALFSSAFFSGCLLAAALLTTPRIGFLLPAFAIFIRPLFRHSARKIALIFALTALPVLLFYSLWVWYAFGDYAHYFAFYRSLTAQYTQLSGFYNFVQPGHYLLIPLVAFSVVCAIFLQQKHWFNSLNIFCLLSIFLFYFLVKDPGPYAVFITPMFYILLLSPLRNVGLGQPAG